MPKKAPSQFDLFGADNKQRASQPSAEPKATAHPFVEKRRAGSPHANIGPQGSARHVHADERYLNIKEVAGRYGVSRATIWRWVKTQPGFPAGICVSPGTTRWALSDLLAFERAFAGTLEAGDAK